MMTNLTDLTEKAYNLLNKSLDYNSIMEHLQSDDLINISLALLNIDIIEDQEHLIILIDLLNSSDSRIRELTSSVLKKLSTGHEHHIFFNKEKTINILINQITDKNPKVCKNIINILGVINNKQLVINNLVDNLKNEKETYSLYWHLEALQEIAAHLDLNDTTWDDVFNILEEYSIHEEYPIREQISYIIKKLNKIIKNNNKVNSIKEKLSEDPNFYVRFALK